MPICGASGVRAFGHCGSGRTHECIRDVIRRGLAPMGPGGRQAAEPPAPPGGHTPCWGPSGARARGWASSGQAFARQQPPGLRHANAPRVLPTATPSRRLRFRLRSGHSLDARTSPRPLGAIPWFQAKGCLWPARPARSTISGRCAQPTATTNSHVVCTRQAPAHHAGAAISAGKMRPAGILLFVAAALMGAVNAQGARAGWAAPAGLQGEPPALR